MNSYEKKAFKKQTDDPDDPGTGHRGVWLRLIGTADL